MSAPRAPDQLSLEHDLAAAAYRCGEVSGRWRTVRLEWPKLFVTISAAMRDGAPPSYGFKLDCSGYRQVPPTAQPWDHDQNAPLAPRQWPGGEGVVANVFRPDWEQGRCLYHPCDRITISTHPDWAHQHPARLWRPERGIICFLEQIHDLLHSTHYSGLRGA